VTQLAWAPSHVPSTIALGSVLVSSEQKNLDQGLYLSLLGDRLQRLLENQEDPQEALNQTLELLEQAGLWNGQRPELSDAGSELVLSNPPLQERLNLAGATLLHKGKPLVHEMPAARAQLQTDLRDPLSALENWLGLLTQQQ